MIFLIFPKVMNLFEKATPRDYIKTKYFVRQAINYVIIYCGNQTENSKE